MTGPITLPGNPASANSGRDEAVCGCGTGVEVGSDFGIGSDQRTGNGSWRIPGLACWEMGRGRAMRKREGNLSTNPTTSQVIAQPAGTSVFRQQSGEHPVCDVELELGADAVGQSGDGGERHDSFESVPAGDRHDGERESLHIPGLHFRNGNGGGGAGHGRNLHVGSEQRNDHRDDDASAQRGALYGGFGEHGNSGSVERRVGERYGRDRRRRRRGRM